MEVLLVYFSNFYLLYSETTSRCVTQQCFTEPVSLCGSTSLAPWTPAQSELQPQILRIFSCLIFIPIFCLESSNLSPSRRSGKRMIYFFPLSLLKKLCIPPCWLILFASYLLQFIGVSEYLILEWLQLSGWASKADGRKPYYLAFYVSNK